MSTPEAIAPGDHQSPVGILRPNDVKNITIEESRVQRVCALLTPTEILMQQEFPTPETINLTLYPDFLSLKLARERIRLLQLLPIKPPEGREYYQLQPKEALQQSIDEFLSGEPLVLAPNNFPHALPSDVRQHVVWIQDPTIDHHTIARFIAQSMEILGVPKDDAIFFERPRAATTPLVRPTYLGTRHVHFWTPNR